MKPNITRFLFLVFVATILLFMWFVISSLFFRHSPRSVFPASYYRCVIGSEQFVFSDTGMRCDLTSGKKFLPCYDVLGIVSTNQIEAMVHDCVPLAQQISVLFPSANLVIDYRNLNTLCCTVTPPDLLIKVGEATYYQEKMRALRYVVNALTDRLDQVVYIDVRAYRTPAVKLKR